RWEAGRPVGRIELAIISIAVGDTRLNIGIMAGTGRGGQADISAVWPADRTLSATPTVLSRQEPNDSFGDLQRPLAPQMLAYFFGQNRRRFHYLVFAQQLDHAPYPFFADD